MADHSGSVGIRTPVILAESRLLDRDQKLSSESRIEILALAFGPTGIQ